VRGLIYLAASAMIGWASVSAGQGTSPPATIPSTPSVDGSTPASRAPGCDSTLDTGLDFRGPIYNGRAHQTNVKIPRLAADLQIDGTLSAAPWRQAAVLSGFSEYEPVDGQPASDSTQVLVWYSSTAIYFGIRAFEAHGAVHATLANRDLIDGDDNVHLVLTPFVHGRHALDFAVNPLGVQEDGTFTEGVTATGYGANTTSGPPPVDLSADFVYESRGHLTPFGFEVEVRIPFRSIVIQQHDPQDWGINIIRNVQHSGEMDTWVPTRAAAASFLAQSGTLVGLTGLDRGLVLDLNPIVTEKALGNPAVGPNAGWHYGVERPQFGGNVRYGLTNNLTLDGTLRPDFAEVESDATVLKYDPRQAVQYPEKRPFFLDGIEQFNVPNNIIYTRQILAPIGAVKLTGKVGNVNLAYLGALDDEGSPSVGGFGHPTFGVLRMLSDVGEASQVGVVATDKEIGGSYNRVAGVDARFTWDKIYSLALQGAASDTRTLTSTTAGVPPTAQTNAGPLWEAHFIRGGRSFGANYDLFGVDPEWIPGAGFISRAGVVNLNADDRYTWYFSHGSFLQTFTPEFQFVNIWTYRNFTDGGPTEDRKYHFTGTATLFGGWTLSGAIFLEHFGYDPQLYANYYLGHINGHDTTFTHYVGTGQIPNTDCVVTLQTPAFAKFDFRINYVTCRDDNFFEWASANINNTTITLNWRPTPQVRAQFTYNAQYYHRRTDGSLVASTRIPRLDFEYQLSRPIFLRLVGQYDAVHQDNLRDASRTELPIFFRDSVTGAYTRATGFTNNQFSVQALFAYQPVPGTVVFLGYGDNLTEPTSFQLVTLRRTADSFFVKFSYLFRM
jgi:hypothetical protein